MLIETFLSTTFQKLSSYSFLKLLIMHKLRYAYEQIIAFPVFSSLKILATLLATALVRFMHAIFPKLFTKMYRKKL